MTALDSPATPPARSATPTTPSKDNDPPKKIPSAVEFEPPLACVRRILRNSLPNSTAVGKDASAAFARACGIFIIYVTACANDFAREHKRQTITANDVLAAVKELDFESFTPDLTKFLEAYRKSEKSKKDAKAAAKKERESKEKSNAEEDDESDDEEDDVVVDEEADDDLKHQPSPEALTKKRKDDTGDAPSPKRQKKDEDTPDPHDATDEPDDASTS